MKLSSEQYKAFLDDLAKNKKMELSDIKTKMANCGPPGFTGPSGVCSHLHFPFIFIIYTN